MPELPEVQTIVDDLGESSLMGCRISDVKIFWDKSIATPTPAAFRRQIKGQYMSAVDRRGKFIIIQMQTPWHLLVHLRMTGSFEILNRRSRRSKHARVIFRFNNGRRLCFRDPRKFGRLYLVPDPHLITGTLGMEPLSSRFTAAWLENGLSRVNRIIKPLLLDQTFIAGLGNIYVDEALWDAKLHPRRKSDSLTTKEAKTLHRSIRKVLRRGLESKGTTLELASSETTFRSLDNKRGRNREFLKVFRKTDHPCPRCGTAVKRLLVGQRGTHICPICQPLR